FSFSRKNLWKALLFLLVALSLVFAQHKAMIKYIGLSASTKPHQDRGAMPKKASGTSGASFGPVIERMLRSVTAERPIKGQDFDTGRQIELPVELEKAPEEQFFHWVSDQ